MPLQPTIKPLEVTFLADICKALAHPARIRILKQLIDEDGCVCGRIVKVMPLAQSTVSQHLKILKNAGLIRGEVDGPSTCYCVNSEKISKFHGLFETIMAGNTE